MDLETKLRAEVNAELEQAGIKCRVLMVAMPKSCPLAVTYGLGECEPEERSKANSIVQAFLTKRITSLNLKNMKRLPKESKQPSDER